MRYKLREGDRVAWFEPNLNWPSCVGVVVELFCDVGVDWVRIRWDNASYGEFYADNEQIMLTTTQLIQRRVEDELRISRG